MKVIRIGNVRRSSVIALCLASCLLIAIAASSSASGASKHGAALAATVGGNTTYDRPGITTVPGGYEIAWAGTDANGEANGAEIDSNGAIRSGTKWTVAPSSTYQGTGMAIASDPSIHFALVAWTDRGKTVHVALDVDGGPGIECDSTNFGSSVDTPYLTVAADGAMYLTTVDSSNAMHVTEVDQSPQKPCDTGNAIDPSGKWLNGPSTPVLGNTTYDGPTLVDLNGTGSPDLWLIWAGTNSAHSINIAKFTPGNGSLGTKYVESNHGTTADMGSTNAGSGAFFTYCGTDNVVRGQFFSGTGLVPEPALGGSCAIYTNSAGYVNGGADVTYDPATGSFVYIFPNKADQDLTVDTYRPTIF